MRFLVYQTPQGSFTKSPEECLEDFRANIYRLKGSVNAEGLEDAFVILNIWDGYESRICVEDDTRSLSRGDILLDPTDMSIYVVSALGFTQFGFSPAAPVMED